MNTSDRYYHLNLSVGQDFGRINSSPYPYIPATYYVLLNDSNPIRIYSFDADGDPILCQAIEDQTGFFTVLINDRCTLVYDSTRPGRQYGQFWLMDRSDHRPRSKSLISIEVYVLHNVACKNKSNVFFKNIQNPERGATLELNGSIELLVGLHSDCDRLEPEDQIITELSALCSNDRAEIVSNGSIQVRFECQFNSCGKYPICFVGEFGMKLPTTDLLCIIVDVKGSSENVFCD